MGKLIVLQRVREEAAREALARASDLEDRARTAERGTEERRRAAAEALAAAEREALAGTRPAQVLQFKSRHWRQLEQVLVGIEVQFAALRGERISAQEARERIRASHEATRARREKLEERLRAARRDARRRRMDAADREQDDLPPRGGRDV
jgi:hypothetical protein